MQFIVLGLSVVVASVCLALVYARYCSERAKDRRIETRLRDEYRAAHRRELYDRTTDGGSSG